MQELNVLTTRNGVIETRHRVSVVVLCGMKQILSLGNPDLVVPMRSTAKPFMAVPLLRFTHQCGIELSDAQITLIASSHNGESIHRNGVKSILEMANATENDLHCGSHLPFYELLYDEYFSCVDINKRQLFHNCSGKHAGMILLAELAGYSKASYWDADHPVQQLITASIKDILKISDKDYFCLGLDGCGVPRYCITLKKLAYAYQLMYLCPDMKHIYNAIMNEPYMIAGKYRIDTEIIKSCGMLAKSGSDGLFCISYPFQNISIALKVEDGNDDAAEAAIVEVLNILGLLGEKQKNILEPYHRLPIYTSTGICVGNYEPKVL